MGKWGSSFSGQQPANAGSTSFLVDNTADPVSLIRYSLCDRRRNHDASEDDEVIQALLLDTLHPAAGEGRKHEVFEGPREFLDGRAAAGEPGAFSLPRFPHLTCPECGPVQLAPEQLRRWLVDRPGFLGANSRAGGVTGPSTPILPSRLLRLGKAKWGVDRARRFSPGTSTPRASQ
jgi:hypothetical protein